MGRWDAAVALVFWARRKRGKAAAAVLLAIGVSVCSYFVVYSESNSLRVEAVDLVRIAAEYPLKAEVEGEGTGRIFWVNEYEQDITGETDTHQFCDETGNPKLVKLTAKSEQGSCFLYWKDLASTVPERIIPERQLLMDGDKHVIAVFATGGACPLDSSEEGEGNGLGETVADESTSSSGPAGFTGSGQTDSETSATGVEMSSPITRFNFAYEDDAKILRATFSGDATDLSGQTVVVELSYINDVNFEIGTIGRSSTHIPGLQSGELRLKASVLWDNPAPAPGRYRVTARAYIDNGDGATAETAEATQTFYVLRYGDYAVPLSAGESKTRLEVFGKGEVDLPRCLRGQIVAEQLSLRMTVINLGSNSLDQLAKKIRSSYVSFKTAGLKLFRNYAVAEAIFRIELPSQGAPIPPGGTVDYKALVAPSVAEKFLGDDKIFSFACDATDPMTQGLGIGRAFEMRVRFPESAANVIFLKNELALFPTKYAWAYGGKNVDGCAPIADQRVSVPPAVDDEGDKLYFSIDHKGHSTLYERDMLFDKTQQLYEAQSNVFFATPAPATHPDGTKVVYLFSSEGNLYAIDPTILEKPLWSINVVKEAEADTQLPPCVVLDGSSKVKMLLLGTESGAYAVEIPADSSKTEPTSVAKRRIFEDKIVKPVVYSRKTDTELAGWFVTDADGLKRAVLKRAVYDGRSWSVQTIDEGVSTGLMLDSRGNVFYGKTNGDIAWSDIDDTDTRSRNIGNGKAVIDIDIEDDVLYATTAGGQLVRCDLSNEDKERITEDDIKCISCAIEGAAEEDDWRVTVYKTDKAEAAFVASGQRASLRGYTIDNHKAPKELVDLHVTIWSNPDALFCIDVNEGGMFKEPTKPIVFVGTTARERLLLGSGDGHLHAFNLTTTAIPEAYHDGTD